MPKVLPLKVKMSLNKALDSALLAIEIYNKPASKFKSGNYIVLMCIAWTSLFHAFFFRKKVKPFHKEKNSRYYKKVEGEFWFWELKTCVDEYFKTDQNNPIRKNIEFFIPLRNKLEHKFVPEIDATIFAECQSCLLNFDKIVLKEFGEEYCLRESLTFALQLFPSSKSLNMSVVENSDSKSIVAFINNYRSAISADILQSGEYSFKAYLIQVANHQSKDALPIQFVAYDKLSEEDKNKVTKIAALVKDKHITHDVVNKNKIKPGKVTELVQKALGNPKKQSGKKTIDKFNADAHTRCWKIYDVRPLNGAEHPERTQHEYCVYDETNKNYLFTPEWVAFLVSEMQDQAKYNKLYK